MAEKAEQQDQRPRGRRLNEKRVNAASYIPFYEFLLYDPKYNGMSDKAKGLYSYLRDKTEKWKFKQRDIDALIADGVNVPESKSYKDEDGNLYIIADNVELTYLFHVSEPTLIKLKKELADYALLEETPDYSKDTAKRRANRIYILEPEPEQLSDRWAYLDDIEEIRAAEKQRKQKKHAEWRKKKKDEKVAAAAEKPVDNPGETNEPSNLKNLSYSNLKNLSHSNLKNLREDNLNNTNTNNNTFLKKDSNTKDQIIVEPVEKWITQNEPEEPKEKDLGYWRHNFVINNFLKTDAEIIEPMLQSLERNIETEFYNLEFLEAVKTNYKSYKKKLTIQEIKQALLALLSDLRDGTVTIETSIGALMNYRFKTHKQTDAAYDDEPDYKPINNTSDLFDGLNRYLERQKSSWQ